MSDNKGAVRPVDLFITTQTVAGTSSPYRMSRGDVTFQATVVTTSTGASAVCQATTIVQVSNDSQGWLPLGTCISTGSGTASDGFASVAPWAYARLVVTTLTTGIAAVIKGFIGY